MFPIQKLESLPGKTRLRKIVLILQETQNLLTTGRPADMPHLLSILNRFRDDFPDFVRGIIDGQAAPGFDPLRFTANLSYGLLKYLGSEPAEWDFTSRDAGVLDQAKRITCPFKIFLEDLRSPFNVGSIFRSAESFGVSHVYLTSLTPLPTHPKAIKTSRGCSEIIPWSVTGIETIAALGEPVFALELGGTMIGEFPFPASGIALIGSEELGLSPEALKLADEGLGRVTIPLYGAKQSLNVATAFGIMAHAWFAAVNRGGIDKP
jgi:RNA methyltransferase, TrmH family